MTDDDSPSRESAAVPVRRGASIGRYIVLRRLGQGGMGIVYAAYDPELDRKVAIKLLHETCASGRARARMLVEAKAIAQLHHPNVVTIYDVGTHEGRVYIAMELVEGVTLRRWLAAQRRPWPAIVETMTRCARGLAAAHAASLIHRDFKPDNVIVGAGRVVVLDFGLARRIDEREPARDITDETPPADNQSTGEHDLTEAGARLGTPAYMAPEQYMGAPVDARTDQFSLCVVAWEALFGERPYQVHDEPTLHPLARGGLRAPLRHRDVPVAVRKVLERGLAASPDDRYPSLAQLLDDLQAAARRPRWLRRASLVSGAAGVLALGVYVAQPAHPPCEAPPWSGVWSVERQTALRADFEASGASSGIQAWMRVAPRVERYTEQWSQRRLNVCRVARANPDKRALTELQVTCLDAARDRLATTLNAFESRDAHVIEGALEAIQQLPPLERCEDPADLTRRFAGLDESYGARLARQLDEARAERDTGRYRRGLTIVAEVLDRAAEHGTPSLRAEALVVQADLYANLGAFEKSRQALFEAVWAADAMRRDDVAAQAYVRLVWVVGVELGNAEQGHVWAAFAHAALSSRAPSSELSVRLSHNLGGLLFAQGRYREALTQYRRAAAAQADLLEPDDPAHARTLEQIGECLTMLRRFDEARASLDEALAFRRRVLGPEHPKVAWTLTRQAELARRQDDRDAQLELAQRALALTLGRSDPARDEAALLVADALRHRGRLGEAAVPLRAALDSHRRGETDVDLQARLLNALAGVSQALGNHADAVTLWRRAVALDRGPQPKRALRALRLQARSQQALGQPDAARESLREALTLASRWLPHDGELRAALVDDLAHDR